MRAPCPPLSTPHDPSRPAASARLSGSSPDAQAVPGKLPPLAALRYRDFAFYAFARFSATLAGQMLTVAVGWQLYQLTGDPLDLGFVGLAQFLPFVLLVLPAGQLADRIDRRLVLLVAYALEAGAAAMLLYFAFAGLTSAWPVFAAMALVGASRALWMPTGQAMTPNLVPLHVFPSAIAVNSTAFQVGVIVGPAVGGLLYLAGPAAVYGTALALLVLVLVCVMAIRPMRRVAAAAAFRLRDVLEGLHFVRRRRTVFGAITLDLWAVLAGGATAMLPIYASDVLAVGPAGLGALRTAPAIGAAATALVLSVSPVTRHVGRWMFGGVAVFGAGTVVFGLSESFVLTLVALAVLGAGDMVSVFIRSMLVQLETPDAIRGRVSAVNAMFIGASNELGEFESGLAARIFGLVPSVVIGGVATLGVVGIYLRRFPELRLMDRLPQGRRS
jgi:MFS family permease